MADLNTVVNDFLRDAQYRVAELAIAIDNAKRKQRRRRGTRMEQERGWRRELLLWMDILYDSRNGVYGDDYNFLGDWSDREIISECEYLRAKTGMNDVPWITWAGYSQSVRNVITGGGGDSLPAGTEDDIIIYDANNNPVTQPFPSVGGMQGETISEYFN